MKAMAYMITFGMTACIGQDLTAPVEDKTVADESGVMTSELRSKSFTADDISLPDVDPKDDVVSLAQDCVFIQWCDERPTGGQWMVVGKVRPACASRCAEDAMFVEFVGDAKAVCGRNSLDDGKWRLDCF